MRGGQDKTGLELGADYLRSQIKHLSGKPGVYRMIGARGEVLYVGKAKNIHKRVSSYAHMESLAPRLQRMVARVRGLEIVETHTESEALLLEANLIRRHKPPYNVLLRDDKSFPLILIAQDHDFPQILKHRGAKTRRGHYFGPFASAASVGEALIALQKAFKLRSCSDGFFAARKRPCLLYGLKRCSAPCVGKITKESYATSVDQACAFLTGRGQDIQAALARDMQTASDAMDFERAAALRDRIRALTALQARQDVDGTKLGDADVIALARKGALTAIQLFIFRAGRHYGARVYFPAHDEEVENGEILAAFISQFYADKDIPDHLILSELPGQAALIQTALQERKGRKVTLIVPMREDKKRIMNNALANASQALARKMAQKDVWEKAFAKLADILALKKTLQRIEVYDNSHTSGTRAVGGMIVASPEGFMKKAYRRFNIKTAPGDDDFAMMREVLTRRMKRLLAENPNPVPGVWPDLILIDGGAGQVAKVRQVLDELGIVSVVVMGIAKGPDRNAGRERFFLPGRQPFSLPPGDNLLFQLQTLRDEAHRYAITTHRARREKAMVRSSLDGMPGIGPARKKALLHAFGSAKAIEAAGVADLSRVPGISAGCAKKIYDFFHSGV